MIGAFKIPDSWEQTTVGDTCYIAARLGWKGLKASEYVDSGPILLSVGNLNHGDVVSFESVQHLTNERFDESPEIKLKNNDVLLVKDGAGIGKNGIVRKHRFDATINSSLLLIRTGNVLNPKYLHEFIKSLYFQNLVLEKTTGSTTPHLFQHEIKQLPIHLPPKAEQARIVSLVESLQKKSSRANKVLSDARPLMSQLRQRVLHDAFCGRLTERWRSGNSDVVPANEILAEVHEHDDGAKTRRRIKKKGALTLPKYLFRVLPDSWSYATVDECLAQGLLIDFVDGNHGGLYPRKNEFGDCGIEFITAKQIKDGVVDFSAAPKLNEERANELQKGWAKGGDVLLTHNATVGRVARTPAHVGTFLLGTSATYYRCNNDVLDSDFLYHVFCGPQWQGQLSSVMEQTTRNQVSIQKQAFFRIPVAPIEEQREIARVLDECMSWIDNVEAGFATLGSDLKQLDQTILAKAFRGELVPQDPRDQPASVLLENVKIFTPDAVAIESTIQDIKAMKLTLDDVKSNHLQQILKRKRKALTPEELWEESDLEIRDFYIQLAREIERKMISESKDRNISTERRLSAK